MSAATLRETRGKEGFVEIGVYRDGKLIAAITRPVTGAKWFLHRVGKVSPRGEPFKTRKAALEAVGA